MRTSTCNNMQCSQTKDRSLRERTRGRETITIRDVNFASAMPQTLVGPSTAISSI
jgi:hypothetical protein